MQPRALKEAKARLLDSTSSSAGSPRRMTSYLPPRNIGFPVSAFTPLVRPTAPARWAQHACMPLCMSKEGFQREETSLTGICRAR